uniref:Nudix hydrolase domain-containing protein n=1 Tax=Glossina palpalis gambiensis TaxID=67801 RepID=A0A1B0BJG1_9MUSC
MAKQLNVNFRTSASLILLAKDKLKPKGTADYKTLLFNRHEKSTFMPNSAVFPGGVSETTDESPLWYQHFQKFGVTKEQLDTTYAFKGARTGIYKNENPNLLKRELSLRITAIRETFEEVGIMLCLDTNSLRESHHKIYGAFKEDFDRRYWQKVVHGDASKFLTLCEELKIIPDLWSLHEWSNWFTPSTFKKRFDTAFFMVALENVPELLIEPNEVKDYAWKTPLDFLKAYHRKECWLPPPQIYELSRCLNFNELSQIIAYARQHANKGSIVTLPVLYKCTDGQVSLLPGDQMYPTDPYLSQCAIATDKSIEAFRSNVQHLHRIEFFGSHDVVIRMNIEPFVGHVRPVNANPRRE